ncbi:MAG TPA: sigma-70 family RNA polymerase sigma factor, partial [Verrucomicrobiae bacterium]|nr:sigma-70 family RNA polymerase sigma factor [Verrucomicrobiae bacterium]
LCRTYWFPLYAYIRRQGRNPEEASDLTQAFFERFLEKDYLRQVDRKKGKFRSFLLASLRHFLSDERDRARAAKRGGGRPLISLDQQTAEERYLLEPVDEASPDRIFERRWALTLLDQAQQRLRAECAEAGKIELYEQLTGTGSGVGKGEPTYTALGARWGITEGAVKSAAHRLRQRFHELVRDEVAQTVSDPAELDDEIRYLMAIISS